jgi:hypothetical protein
MSWMRCVLGYQEYNNNKIGELKSASVHRVRHQQWYPLSAFLRLSSIPSNTVWVCGLGQGWQRSPWLARGRMGRKRPVAASEGLLSSLVLFSSCPGLIDVETIKSTAVIAPLSSRAQA